MSCWDKLPKPFLTLAPMEDVTDSVFRQVILRAGRPDLFFTEFANTTSFAHPSGRSSTARRLQFKPSEKPLIAQIWGNTPEHFAATAHELAKMGFDGVDINMGCPDKSVVKQGSGAGLINDFALSAKLIAATKQGAGKLPVSVKTRLNDTQLEGWQDWIAHLLQQDLANLTIHLRTRKEMSKVPAHYELIAELLSLRDQLAPKTLITINGDIPDRAAALKLHAKHPGVDGIMIGRGVFSNPFCFTGASRPPTRESLLGLLAAHLDLFDQAATSPQKFDPLKKFFKIYLRDFPGAKSLREKLMQSKNTAEVRQILAQAEPQPQVIIYSADWCEHCADAKTYLEEHGVIYEERDVTQNREYVNELATKTGSEPAIPIFQVNDQILVGFNENRAAIDKLLGLQ